MLANNFMSSAALDIIDQEFEGLVKVLGMLERGELRHVPHHKPSSKKGNGFRMADWDCGSAACIGGWIERITKIRFYSGEYSPALEQLYFPEDPGDDENSPYDANTEQAARAVRNFLTYGQPRWREVMAHGTT